MQKAYARNKNKVLGSLEMTVESIDKAAKMASWDSDWDRLYKAQTKKPAEPTVLMTKIAEMMASQQQEAAKKSTGLAQAGGATKGQNPQKGQGNGGAVGHGAGEGKDDQEDRAADGGSDDNNNNNEGEEKAGTLTDEQAAARAAAIKEAQKKKAADSV